MNTITHALLPVIGVKILKKTEFKWTNKKLVWLAIFGALPDLLNPHLSLNARFTSFSHSVFALFYVMIALLMIKKFTKISLDFKLILFFWGAYLLHLICDMISGGIAWGYPFYNSVIGGTYISWIWWCPLDILCVLIIYILSKFDKRKTKQGV